MQFASERSSAHSWIFKERERRYVRNSRLTVDATWPPCSSPRRHSCARGNRESRGGRTQRTCRARATSNQAFVDVIIAHKRAPSHRVFVAQVFGRNMCGKRRRRHRFSAFWLIGKLPFLDCGQSLGFFGKLFLQKTFFGVGYPVQLSWCLVGPALPWSFFGSTLVLPWSWSCLGLGLALVLVWPWSCRGLGSALVLVLPWSCAVFFCFS
jgi:hypothetical protein